MEKERAQPGLSVPPNMGLKNENASLVGEAQ
jgi:hypothetical protein